MYFLLLYYFLLKFIIGIGAISREGIDHGMKQIALILITCLRMLIMCLFEAENADTIGIRPSLLLDPFSILPSTLSAIILRKRTKASASFQRKDSLKYHFFLFFPKKQNCIGRNKPRRDFNIYSQKNTRVLYS